MGQAEAVIAGLGRGGVRARHAAGLHDGAPQRTGARSVQVNKQANSKLAVQVRQAERELHQIAEFVACTEANPAQPHVLAEARLLQGGVS